MRISKSSFLLGIAGASCLSLAACDRQKDELPAAVTLQEPTPPPPAASEAPSAAAAPAPAPVPQPARVGVAEGAPSEFVADRWVAGGECNIENIGESTKGGKPIVLKAGVHSKVTGWVLAPGGKTIPDSVHIRFLSKGGDYYGTVSKRTVREDVNTAHTLEDKAATSGFELEFDTDQLPAGSYTVTTILLAGEKAYICDNGRKVTRVP